MDKIERYYESSLNLDQERIIEIGLEDDVDIIDLAIIQCCRTLNTYRNSAARPRLHDGYDVYFLTRPKEILSRLPLVKITESEVSERIKKLCDIGIFKKCPKHLTGSSDHHHCYGPMFCKFIGQDEE